MIWLLAPAAIAFAVKIAILWFSRSTFSSGESTLFFRLIIVASIHNVCEMMTFSNFLFGLSPEYLFRSYYVLTCALLCCICAYAVEVSEIKVKGIYHVIAGACAMITVLVLFTDHVVAGYTAIDYSITAIKAPHYWIAQITAISLLISTVAFLVAGYLRANTHQTEVRCVYTLFALLPIVLCVLLVVGLMALGAQVNGMMVIPISITLFILVTLKTETLHKVTDIRRHLPYSLERKVIKRIVDASSDYMMDRADHKTTLQEIERTLVEHKQAKEGNNVSRMANSMGVGRPTLYSMLKRLDISLKRD